MVHAVLNVDETDKPNDRNRSNNLYFFLYKLIKIKLTLIFQGMIFLSN